MMVVMTKVMKIAIVLMAIIVRLMSMISMLIMMKQCENYVHYFMRGDCDDGIDQYL